MTTFQLEKEFKQWAIDIAKLQENTTSNYRSWMRNQVLPYFESAGILGVWDNLPTAFDDCLTSGLQHLSVLDFFVNNNDVLDGNNISSFRSYCKFLKYYFNDEEKEEIEKIESPCSPLLQRMKTENDENFKALVKRFKARLSSQDRVSGDLYFPVRLLTKILRNGSSETKAYWAEWRYLYLDELKLYTSKSEEIGLMDISTIGIFDNRCYIDRENGEKKVELYTKTKDGELRAFNISDESELTLEHTVTMKSLLKKYADNLPTLKKITEICKRYPTAKLGYEIAQEVWENAKQELTPLASGVQAEMEFLRKQTRLELMEASENRNR